MSLPKSIGIKLYDDTFVPVLSEQEIKNKRLVLTTVKDNQNKAIIELYEGTSDKCINNEYLGKLVVSIDRETQKGEPGIEVNLRLSEDGMLYAKAWDSESRIESEFKIEHNTSPRIFKETLSNEEIDTMYNSETKNIESFTEDELLGETQTGYEEKPKKDFLPFLRGILVTLIVVVILALLGLGGLFIYKNVNDYLKVQNNKKIEEMKKQEETKRIEEENKKIEAEKRQEEQKRLEEQKKLEEEKLAKLKKEEEERVLKEQMLREQEKIDKIKKESEQAKKDNNVKGIKDLVGKKHFIRKGDNLWNICKRYYKDPWYYPDLAKVNDIKNPRKIYAGRYMIIPAKATLKRWDFSK